MIRSLQVAIDVVRGGMRVELLVTGHVSRDTVWIDEADGQDLTGPEVRTAGDALSEAAREAESEARL